MNARAERGRSVRAPEAAWCDVRVDCAAALARLPHGPPFRFVSEVCELKPEDSARGLWIVSGGEEFLRGHFPGRPVVPGVLIAEALAQMSGVVAFSAGEAEGEPKHAFLAHVDVRFRAPISPPAEIHLASTLARRVGGLRLFEVEASVAGRIVAEGNLALAEGGEENDSRHAAKHETHGDDRRGRRGRRDRR